MIRETASLPQAEDFRTEVWSLHALLATFEPADWFRPTAFKHWTAIDIVGHLHMADRAAKAALESRDAFHGFMAEVWAHGGDARDAMIATRRWLNETNPSHLMNRWRSFAETLADDYAARDPRSRVPWGRGPDMSARSCISARQMEVWSHGQALFDLAGVERDERDRLHNIAVLGVNTFEWAFRNRALPVPPPCRVQLAAPSGAVWLFNPDATGGGIEGAAADFCRVVTQTRNIADTGLILSGEAAADWMQIAQCFAGPPHDPPIAGTRRICDRLSQPPRVLAS